MFQSINLLIVKLKHKELKFLKFSASNILINLLGHTQLQVTENPN